MDPFQIITDAQDDARGAVASLWRDGRDGPAGLPDALESYLDMEERIVYPWLDRCGPDGSDEMAEGSRRHETMLSCARDRPPQWDRLLGALDGHIRLTRDGVFRVLRDSLDETALEDLGDALEEARLSRQEDDQDLPAPLDQSVPSAPGRPGAPASPA